MTSRICVNAASPRTANPRAGVPSACHGQCLCSMVWSGYSNWPPRSTTMTMLTKRHWWSNVNHDGNNGNGGDSDGDGNGDCVGNGNDAAAANDGNNVDEEDGGNSRMAIGQWQLDNNNGMTRMWWQWVASNMQNTCKCCVTYPRQQSNNADSLERSGLVQLLRLAK